jgi:hypothetical protein
MKVMEEAGKPMTQDEIKAQLDNPPWFEITFAAMRARGLIDETQESKRRKGKSEPDPATWWKLPDQEPSTETPPEPEGWTLPPSMAEALGATLSGRLAPEPAPAKPAARGKLTEKMQTVLAAMPADGSPIVQEAIYAALGFADGVGATLHALAKRGIVEHEAESGWRIVAEPEPEPAPRKRRAGRPKGSKNKPKDESKDDA